MTFIEYLKGLAQENETMLFVRQTPILHAGEVQYYADGAVKSTYPAYTSPHIKEGESWYVNSGIFIPDRFINGKPSAKRDNIQLVAFMVLDDIGTKSKTPPLEPTWKIETSPGNYQWGYVFSDAPDKFTYSAAIVAIADAGFSDPGAINPVRNARLPGSVNLKRGKGRFAARLEKFNPHLEYTLDEICRALGVEIGEISTVEYAPLRLKDTGNDSVLHWLNEKALVYTKPNADGWTAIHCPNAASHSDGNPEARYNPLERTFCCFHAGCQHLDSRAFLSWVADQGGPKVEPGLRDDLLADRMAKVAEAIRPNDVFRDTAAEIIAEVDRKEASRVERSQWHARFAYVLSDDTYFDMVERRELTRSAFNALYRHVSCQSVHNGRRVEASIWFDENRHTVGGRVLEGVTYAAGDSALVAKDGQVFGNRWIDARPDLSHVQPGDISPWLEHAERLLPDPEERAHVFNVMAFKLQNPRVKINHAVLHGGDQGCGKDTLWAPFLWGVCGPNLRNRGLVDGKGISSRWGYALESEVLILNELKETEASERRALANSLKPIIAAPPDTLTIERKGLHPYDMVNRLLVLAFTNESVPITLETQDRRWFCVWSNAPRMTDDARLALWGWYKSGGFERVAKWLALRDVSAFDPKATPMAAEYKSRLIENGRSMAESYVMEQIERRSSEFALGVVASPWHKICSALQNGSPNGIKIPQQALLHALKEAGWDDMGMVKTTEYQTKKNMWARPDMLKKYNKSELRRMLEQPPETGLKLVK